MAGAQLSITVPVGAALARLDGLDAALADPSDLLARVGERLRISTRRRFITQTDPGGRSWNPLEPNYKRSKKYNRDKVLTLRGHLRSSIRWQPEGRDAVLVGTNIAYGAIHQLGGTIQQAAQSRQTHFRKDGQRHLFAKRTDTRAQMRWVTRPAYTITIAARPYLGISRADERELQQITQSWLARQR